MLALFWAACASEDPIDVDTVTNQWWHLVDNDMNIFLEQLEGEGAGDLWYDFLIPELPLEENYYAGEWEQLDEHRFRLDYFGDEYTVRAFPADEPGCYDLRLGIIANDLACPYTGEISDTTEEG